MDSRQIQRHRYINENSEILKHKLPKNSQPQRLTTATAQRVALGAVSSNVTNSLRASSKGLAQRVQIYSDRNTTKDVINDENAVPVRSAVSKDDLRSERQPLAEVREHEALTDSDKAEPDVAASDNLDSEFLMEEDDRDDIPKGLMPVLNPTIYRELIQVYQKFYSPNLDEEDEDTYDVSMVAEYSPEIFNYMHSLEMKLRPNPRYMESQTELKWNMRSILIDWVIQVHSRFNLAPETLFLTVNYIDRFLSRRKVSLSKFQLVGAVALFIAAKFEEINCPSVKEIAYMVDHAYSVEDILRAERFMIDVLEFEMGWPGPMSFLRRTSKADDYDYETRTAAKYFLEITVMDYRFVASPPSWLAAGAHYLSRLILNKGDWTEAHVYYSGYTAEQLNPLAQTLLEACRNPEEHHNAIFEKYQERRFRRSSLFVQDWFALAAEN